MKVVLVILMIKIQFKEGNPHYWRKPCFKNNIFPKFKHNKDNKLSKRIKHIIFGYDIFHIIRALEHVNIKQSGLSHCLIFVLLVDITR